MSDFVCPEGAMVVDVSTRKFPNTFMIVDAEDADLALRYKWSPYVSRHTTYVVRGAKFSGKNRSFRFHREVMQAKPGDVIDHINGNGLDNRKSNLRFSTLAENAGNTDFPAGKFPRGVSENKKRFSAKIRFQGEVIYLGTYDTPEQAHAVYVEKFTELHGFSPVHRDAPAAPSAQRLAAVTIIKADDWEGVYIDGKLQAQAHHLSVIDDILKPLWGMRLGEASRRRVNDDWLEHEGQLPAVLADIPEAAYE